MTGFGNLSKAQKLSVAVDEAKCVITEVIRVMNLEWLLPTYKHVTFIAALHAVRKLQREQHIPAQEGFFAYNWFVDAWRIFQV